MSDLSNVIISAVGTYGLATIVADYDGPFNMFDKIRSTRLGRLFSCNVCLSPYMALIPALSLDIGFVGYIAAVGGTVILARLVV